jgi:hypothetical protein
VYVER